jgi:hypothetical protein
VRSIAVEQGRVEKDKKQVLAELRRAESVRVSNQLLDILHPDDMHV